MLDPTATLERAPRWLQPGGPVPPLDPYVQAALVTGGASVLTELRRLTTGGIARGWVQRPVRGRDVLATQVVNPHPGAVPLDQGAQWPGAWPPFKGDSDLVRWARARGIPPFLVARKLKREGLAARHFVAEALAATSDDVQAILRAQGVERWLQALAAG